MSFDYLTNIPIETARKDFLNRLIEAGLKPRTEQVPTREANHRVTSEAVYARICAPHYNACAMDGIALRAKETYGASESTPVFVAEGKFAWVNTGDPLPEAYDSVVMVEDVIEQEGGVQLASPAVPWQHVRQIGEDIAAGDMILPSFTELQPAALGALLAAGVREVPVFTKPVVGFIPTGNELVDSDADPASGEILEFNSAIFAAILEDWGCTAKVHPVAKDTEDSITNALRIAAEDCDIVIINAGSSAGRKDYAVTAIRNLGEVWMHGIAIKPGKPTILGMVKQGQRVVPVIGLPGYPVSGILVMEQVMLPLVELWNGKQAKAEQFIEASTSRKLTSSLKYLEFIRTRLGWVDDKLVAVPLNRGAGVVSSFVKADGIIHVPQDVEGYEAGEKVQVSLRREVKDIQQTLVVTGSHDPLIDEVADILRQGQPKYDVASSHVGSMGGIMALRRREAHMAGIHLLDEATGEYNQSYLRKYLPDGGVKLISCVRRVQGLMLAKGNPLGIKSLADLPGKRYVNRQKGSGTRILLDYLLKQAGIQADQLDGYHREEFTHTAVAAAVASGTADAGLGILSAARIYDLDFLPVADETYDLIVLEDAIEMPVVQAFLDAIRGQEFANRLERLGGYSLTDPGLERAWH